MEYLLKISSPEYNNLNTISEIAIEEISSDEEEYSNYSSDNNSTLNKSKELLEKFKEIKESFIIDSKDIKSKVEDYQNSIISETYSITNKILNHNHSLYDEITNILKSLKLSKEEIKINNSADHYNTNINNYKNSISIQISQSQRDFATQTERYNCFIKHSKNKIIRIRKYLNKKVIKSMKKTCKKLFSF